MRGAHERDSEKWEKLRFHFFFLSPLTFVQLWHAHTRGAFPRQKLGDRERERAMYVKQYRGGKRRLPRISFAKYKILYFDACERAEARYCRRLVHVYLSLSLSILFSLCFMLHILYLHASYMCVCVSPWTSVFHGINFHGRSTNSHRFALIGFFSLSLSFCEREKCILYIDSDFGCCWRWPFESFARAESEIFDMQFILLYCFVDFSSFFLETNIISSYLLYSVSSLKCQ